MATKNWQNRTIGLYSLPRHSETDRNIAILIEKGSSAIIWLHWVQIW